MIKQNKKGFTLVELVIVIAVIAILAGVLIGTFASVINRANDSANIQKTKSDEIAQKAEDIIKKIEDTGWVSWEDYEADIVAKIVEEVKANNNDQAKIVEKIVQDVVTTAKASNAEDIQASGVTEEQVKAIVENAIGTLQYEGPTEAQVRAAVSATFGEEESKNMSTADVKSIIDRANEYDYTAADLAYAIARLSGRYDVYLILNAIDGSTRFLNHQLQDLKATLKETIEEQFKNYATTPDTDPVVLAKAYNIRIRRANATSLNTVYDVLAKLGADTLEDTSLTYSANNPIFFNLTGKSFFVKYEQNEEGLSNYNVPPTSVPEYQWWKFATVETFSAADTHSQYLLGNEVVSSINVISGFDTGLNTIDTISYANNTSVAKSVVIRTNSASTTLSINAPTDSVAHYGSAGSVIIEEIKTSSYHENGKVAFLEISKGRVVLEPQSDVEHIHIDKKENTNEFDTVIIKDNGTKSLPKTITRDEVDVSTQTLVVTVESVSGEQEEVFVYTDGTTGTTQKTAVQNKEVDTALGVLVLDNGGNAGEKALNPTEKANAKTEVVENAIAQEIVSEFWISVAADSFASGTGTEQDPYMITNATQLARVAKMVIEETGDEYASAYYKLQNDIDLSGKAWTPIGTGTKPFKGYFDGNSKSVIGLTNNGKANTDLNLSMRAFSSGGYGASYGLFGYVVDVNIQNVNIERADINSTTFAEAGIIVGHCQDSITISNCSVDSDSSLIGLKKLGGIIGMIDLTKNLTSTPGATVTIDNCDFAGYVKATANSDDRPSGIIGGLCGDSGIFYTIYLQNCDVTGTIESTSYYGALVAHIYNIYASDIFVENCTMMNSYKPFGSLQCTFASNLSTGALSTEVKNAISAHNGGANTSIHFASCFMNNSILIDSVENVCNSSKIQNTNWADEYIKFNNNTN